MYVICSWVTTPSSITKYYGEIWHIMIKFDNIWLVLYKFLDLQVCLMSQSWDNVTNMHELLTACSVLNCQLVQCACADESSTVLWCRPHPSLQAKSSCSNSLCMATFSLIESTTRLWQRIDLASRFAQGSVACWASLSKHIALRAVHSRMRLYGP